MQTNYSSDLEPSALNNVHSKSLPSLKKEKRNVRKECMFEHCTCGCQQEMFPFKWCVAGDKVNRIVFYNLCKHNAALVDNHSKDTKKMS